MKLRTTTIAIGYLLTIPLANWFIQNVGRQQFPNAPHTIPVGFGYTAPSGVIIIGLALFLRDIVQDAIGKRKTIGLITAGIVISYFVNSNVATASAIAFALSELIDFTIYTTIRSRSKPLAVLASGTAGGIIDSLIFLRIAFGSTQFWQGQIIGKTAVAIIGATTVIAINAVSNRLHPSQP